MLSHSWILIKARASWLIFLLSHPNANSCSRLVLRLPTWRSDKVELNEPAWPAFYYFFSKAKWHPQNKGSLITEFLIKSELPSYNFFLPQAMLCPNRYIWFRSDQWMCPSLKPTVSSDIMNDSLMYNQAIMKGGWFSVNHNTLHKPTLIVSYKPQFVSCLKDSSS